MLILSLKLNSERSIRYDMPFTEKYMRREEMRKVCWSTYGAQLLCVQSFALIWLFLPLIPLVCFLCWLAEADSVHFCLFQVWPYLFRDPQVPRSVQLGALAISLWTDLCCTFIVLSSLTRALLYYCIAAFWTRQGARGER